MHHQPCITGQRIHYETLHFSLPTLSSAYTTRAVNRLQAVKRLHMQNRKLDIESRYWSCWLLSFQKLQKCLLRTSKYKYFHKPPVFFNYIWISMSHLQKTAFLKAEFYWCPCLTATSTTSNPVILDCTFPSFQIWQK